MLGAYAPTKRYKITPLVAAAAPPPPPVPGPLHQPFAVSLCGCLAGLNHG